MRVEDIDRSTTPWVYRPVKHKTRHRGVTRTVLITPPARELLAPLMAKLGPTDFVFSPRRERADRLKLLRANRKSPVQPSQVSHAKKRPQRVPGDFYPVHAYTNAVRRACAKAGVPHWHPNQLRHTFASEVRALYGLEAAQVLLGHTKANVSQVYAARDTELAVRVAEQIR